MGLLPFLELRKVLWICRIFSGKVVKLSLNGYYLDMKSIFTIKMKMFSTKSPSMPCKLFTLMQWHSSWAPIIMGNMTHIYAVVFTKFITVILQTFFILAKILRQFMARGSNTWECNYIIIYRVSYKFSFAPVCHLDKLVEKKMRF